MRLAKIIFLSGVMLKEYRISEGAMDTYFGKENDCKLHMLKSNDGRNQEIWVKWDEWIRPKNIISEGSKMPHAVRELLRKWNDEINKIRNEFQNKANIGYAYIDFVYDNVVYKLEPAAIAATKDMFHHLAEMMQRDLKHIGCPYTQYKWELD